MDSVVKNGKILTCFDIFEAGIAIEEEKIVAVAKEPNLPKADNLIDAKGNLIIPGVIDAHVHIEAEPENFETGTKAAAHGGITSVMEMPYFTPSITTVQTFNQKRKRGEREALVDFALYVGAGTDNLDEIPALGDTGAIGFKTFTLKRETRSEASKGLMIWDDGSLTDVFESIGKTGLVSTVHAENDEITEYLAQKLKKEGRKKLIDYLQSKPGIEEEEAVARVLNIASKTKVHLNVCHVSTGKSVNLVRQAKASGQRVTADVCMNHVFLDLEYVKKQVDKLGPYAKITPPPRSKMDVESLWKGLNDGTVDFIQSDHVPCSKDEKEVGWIDIWKAESGGVGIECMLPLLLTQVNKGKISLRRMVEVTSSSAAKIFGIYPKKGAIQVGSDADITIIDMKKEDKLRSEKMYSKGRSISRLFDGWKVKGMPILTMVRGKTVMKDGEVIGKPGYGKFICRR